jgi:hypothetical protein
MTPFMKPIKKSPTKIIVVTACLLIFFCLDSLAQVEAIRPNLSKKENLKPVSRQVSLSADKQGNPMIHLNANDGPGIVWINDLNFSTGTIEFDVKGKDILQESFVGIAFHGANDSTYEGVYFRPFNFQTTDTVRKKHAVQYIALPKFDWFYLRETYPDKYEHSLLTLVDPNNWFHVKIVVSKNKIEAFTNSDIKACLSVEPLTHNLSGKVGFWVGNGSEGDFANLVIKS